MIDQISVRNFQGIPEQRWDLGKLTKIAGPNGAGKSTVSKALQLLILGKVPGDEVPKTVNGQFEAYCSSGAGEMEISISHSDKGVFSKSWKKSRGSVSTKTRFNGQDVGASTEAKDLLDLKVFDIIGFWRQRPNDQISTLCSLADIDPDTLDQINEDIKRSNSQKKKFEDKLQEAKKALSSHESEMQEAKNESVEEDFDPENAEQQIKDLRQKVNRINERVQSSLDSGSKAKGLQERLDYLKKSMFDEADALNKLSIPSSVGDASHLEAEVEQHKRIFEENSRLEIARQRIEKLRKVSQPTPCAHKQADIDEAKKTIAAAETTAGLSDEDNYVYKAMAGFFEAFKGKKSEFRDQEDYKLTVAFIRSHFSDLSERVKAAQGKMDMSEISALRSKLETMTAARKKYDVDCESYRIAQDEIRDIENQINDSEVREYDKEGHEKALAELSLVRQKIEGKELAISQKKDLEESVRKKSEEISKVEFELSECDVEEVDVDTLREERSHAETTLSGLEEKLTLFIKWKTIRDLADKKESEIEDLGKEVKEAKENEAHFKRKRTLLLERIQDSLSDAADLFLSPERLKFELPESMKNTDRIKFFKHGEDGSKVERGTLSGGEQASFDLALGHALVGKGGVVIQETAEMDQKRLENTCEKLKRSKGQEFSQTVLVGHNLSGLDEENQVFDSVIDF